MKIRCRLTEKTPGDQQNIVTLLQKVQQ